MSASPAKRQFEAHGSELPGSAELAVARRAALARFEALGLPQRGSEAWRYTDLSSLSTKALEYVSAAPPANVIASAARCLAELGLDADKPRLVFVDGHWVKSLSSPTALPGLSVTPLSERPAALLVDSAAGDSALVALNQAFVRDGALIHANSAVAVPLTIVCIGSGRGLAEQLRFKLVLGREAALTVTQLWLDFAGTEEAWLNTVVDIDLGEGSRLDLLRLQQHGTERYATVLTRASLAAGARLVTGSVEAGGRLVRNDFEISLSGPEAAAEIAGLSLTRGRQHCDTRIDVDHRAPRTRSSQHYRAIANGESRSVFNGKVTVRENAQHIDARQQNHSLLLSSRAEVDSKPELEIYADQVACSHGATVGEISEDELFYLRARGIDERSARAILTEAFASKVVAQFPQDDFRARARTVVAGWLAAEPHQGS